jgi:hypothetical protein
MAPERRAERKKSSKVIEVSQVEMMVTDLIIVKA